MKIFEYIKGDKIVWGIVIFLSLFSLLAVYSSTGTLAYKYQQGNTEYYVMKHFAILFFGLILMYLMHLVKVTRYSRIAQLLLYISVPLLFLTLILNPDSHSASRWLELPGTNISFQSSDLAKFALIMFLARTLSKRSDLLNADFKTVFKIFMLPVIIICILILPANFSTAFMLFFVSFMLMIIAKIPFKYLANLIGIGVAGILLMVVLNIVAPQLLPRVGTWVSRIECFIKNEASEDDYQVEQAKIAIATGGFIGKLPGNSIQRNFLPSSFSDFIYAIIIEEYGALGGLLILLLYLILFYRAIKIAQESHYLFGSYLAIGLTMLLVVQALINMGVAVNLFPVTGQTLPFVSKGGTSVIFTCISLGVLLSISREIEENKLLTDKKNEIYVDLGE